MGYTKINIYPGVCEAAMKSINIDGYTLGALVTILTLLRFQLLAVASLYWQRQILALY
ncbi:MAG: hypothetical protein AAF959_16825 [Cyanobacteria bacterium P01_D01_bin.56]